jgi:hypothetical protein
MDRITTPLTTKANRMLKLIAPVHHWLREKSTKPIMNPNASNLEVPIPFFMSHTSPTYLQQDTTARIECGKPMNELLDDRVYHEQTLLISAPLSNYSTQK